MKPNRNSNSSQALISDAFTALKSKSSSRMKSLSLVSGQTRKESSLLSRKPGVVTPIQISSKSPKNSSLTVRA